MFGLASVVASGNPRATWIARAPCGGAHTVLESLSAVRMTVPALGVTHSLLEAIPAVAVFALIVRIVFPSAAHLGRERDEPRD